MKSNDGPVTSGESLILRTAIEGVPEPLRRLFSLQLDAKSIGIRPSYAKELDLAVPSLLGLSLKKVPKDDNRRDYVLARVEVELKDGRKSTANVLVVDGAIYGFTNPGGALLMSNAQDLAKLDVTLYPPYDLPKRQQEIYRALDQAGLSYEKRGVEFEELVATESGEMALYGEVGMITFGRTVDTHLWIGVHMETQDEKRFRDVNKFVSWLATHREE